MDETGKHVKTVRLHPPLRDEALLDQAVAMTPQALMKRCTQQVQPSGPGVPENDVKQFCAKEVYDPVRGPP
jgi:hypothetical protein